MRHWRPDPMTEDEAALVDRMLEDAREQRWAEFVKWLTKQSGYRSYGWSDVVVSISDLYVGTQRGFGRDDLLQEILEDDGEILDFADAEGWSGVFAALARAIKEHEALPDDAEMERRR